MSEQEWLSKDFYKVLGVDKKADKKTVTKAYRKLARRWHPDQNPGDKAAEAKFKDIGEAYAVLSNDADRKRYDAIRAMTGGGARFSAGSGAAGGFEDLFGAFGGGGGGGPRVRFQTSGGPGPPASRTSSRASSAVARAHARERATPSVPPRARRPRPKRAGRCVQNCPSRFGRRSPGRP